MRAGAGDDGNRVADTTTAHAPAAGTDVLRRLRTATAAEHRTVEETLDLLDPRLTRDRLVQVLTAMHGFWRAAEAGLDAWARAHPGDAARLDWSRRRRSHLFAADLTSLGSTSDPGPTPDLPPVADTDEALGRLYVLEGSSLGGVFIDRHLAGLPQFAGAGRLAAFSPYGEDTGSKWRAFRQATRDRVAAGGDVDRLVGAAQGTFRALAVWCGARAGRP
ncbi:biliverdin-producing heme oxygenase [Modestobacter sp. I12A-02662]|uniref:biliverdin-producing heme oxygenase n=1 Tax=Modestobacter sp. I12A-02662 TaxID=1730496 RepID=UPI0034E01760